MAEIKDLRAIGIFQAFTNEELEKIQRLIFEKEYRAGATLFLEGMPGEVLYLVKSGQVEIYKRRQDGEFAMAVLSPGDILGEMSLIDDAPRSASARVIRDSRLLVITKKNFQEIMQAHPQAANKILIVLLRIVNRRLRETNEKLASKEAGK